MKYNNFAQKSCNIFHCIDCQYKTRNKNNFQKHILTRKHENTTKLRQKLQDDNTPKNPEMYVCECGKSYPYRASLYNHRKKCIKSRDCEHIQKTGDYRVSVDSCADRDNSLVSHSKSSKGELMIKTSETGEIDYRAMMIQLMEQNAEFKNLLIKQQDQIGELIPKVGNNNTSIKQRFNINIFLNEQCRDAINIQDFLKQIEISIENLLLTRDKGLSEGLSNVFIENMNKLSLYERPLHCTDIKRETLYIKDNDVWEKDIDKTRIKAALRDISITQFKNVKKWMNENPDFKEDEKKQDQFISLIRSCSASLDTVNDKIIKRLCNSSYLKDKLDD